MSRAPTDRAVSPSIWIAIPCYNEASRLDLAQFGSFLGEHAQVGLVFVDDGSTDSTRPLLDSLAERHPEQVRVHSLDRNRGKAEAVRTGIRLASAFHHAVYLGYWDADLATPLHAIIEFAQVLDHRADLELVMGARVQLLGRSIRRRALRHYLGRIFATAASMTLGLPVYDTQCGAKLFRASTGMVEHFDRPFRTRWLFDIELIARMIGSRTGPARPHSDQPIFEYPLMQWHDVAGSRVRPIDFFRAMIELAIIGLELRVSRRSSSALSPSGIRASTGLVNPSLPVSEH